MKKYKRFAYSDGFRNYDYYYIYTNARRRAEGEWISVPRINIYNINETI